MTAAFKKGYKQTEAAKARIGAAASERWRLKKLKKDPKELNDTVCSLCYEYAEAEDFRALNRICTKGSKGCVLMKIWARFLLDFERRIK